MQPPQQPRPGFGGPPGPGWQQQGPPQPGAPRPMGAMPPQQGMMPHQQMPPQSMGGFPPQPQVLWCPILSASAHNMRAALKHSPFQAGLVLAHIPLSIVRASMTFPAKSAQQRSRPAIPVHTTPRIQSCASVGLLVT